MRVTATAMKVLSRWLKDKGLIEQDEADYMLEVAAGARRDLPAIDELKDLLHDYVKSAPSAWGEEILEDVFIVSKVETGKLYLSGAGEEIVVAVPRMISRLFRKGWLVALLLVKTASGWRIARVGKIAPA